MVPNDYIDDFENTVSILGDTQKNQHYQNDLILQRKKTIIQNYIQLHAINTQHPSITCMLL